MQRILISVNLLLRYIDYYIHIHFMFYKTLSNILRVHIL